MATKRTDFSQGYTPQGMPIVLKAEPTCEISDADGELNTVKFTYQYQDRRMYLPTVLTKSILRYFIEYLGILQ